MSSLHQSMWNTLPRLSFYCEGVAGKPRPGAGNLLDHFMERHLQKSRNTGRNIVVGRHRTSVSLEQAFWNGLHEIAATKNLPRSRLLATIDKVRQRGSLSSAIRVFVLEYYRDRDRPPPKLIDPTA